VQLLCRIVSASPANHHIQKVCTFTSNAAQLSTELPHVSA